MIAATSAAKPANDTHIGTDHLKNVNLINPSALGTGVNGTGLTPLQALAVKMHSLGMSAKIIRRSMIIARDEARYQARKAKAAVIINPEVQRLEDIRKRKVRFQIRHHLLAQAFHNNVPYVAVEHICYTNPDWDELEDIIFEFTNDPAHVTHQKLEQWLQSAQHPTKATSDGKWRGPPDDNPKKNVAHRWSVSFRTHKEHWSDYVRDDEGKIICPTKDAHRTTREERAIRHYANRRSKDQWLALQREKAIKSREVAVAEAAKEVAAVAAAKNGKAGTPDKQGAKANGSSGHAQGAPALVKITNIFHLDGRTETQTIRR
jgi:hypothetical protein